MKRRGDSWCYVSASITIGVALRSSSRRTMSAQPGSDLRKFGVDLLTGTVDVLIAVCTRTTRYGVSVCMSR